MALLDFGKVNNFKKEFSSFEELKSFIKSQRLKWEIYFDSKGSLEATTFKTNFFHHNASLDGNLVAIANNNELSSQAFNDGLLHNFYQYGIVFFDTYAGQSIRKCIDASDYKTAIEIYAYFQAYTYGNAHYFEAALKYELNRAGLTTNEIWDGRKALDEKLNDVSSSQAILISKTNEIITEHKIEVTKHSSQISDLITNGKTSLKNLEDTYNEKLRLDAPSKYWRDKAKTHKKHHLELIGILATYIILTAFFSMAFSDNYLNYLDKITTHFSSDILKISHEVTVAKYLFYFRLVIYAVTSLLLSTLIIWPIRHLVRMIISENHLHADAKYKDSLLITYLALHKKGTIVENEDRKIALSAIFTLPQDGLVKDDGMPNWLPNSLFGKPPGS